MSLYYPGLQKEATIQVWKMHLARMQEMRGDQFDIKTKEILKFAKDHYMELKRAKSGSWNGRFVSSILLEVNHSHAYIHRQIRNAFQTAIALAEFEAVGRGEEDDNHKTRRIEFNRDHFATVAQASQQFDKYLRSTLGGQTEADLARLDQTRVDDFHTLVERMEQNTKAQNVKASRRRKPRVETDSEESEELDSEDSSKDSDATGSGVTGSDEEEIKPVKLIKSKKEGRGKK